jgi:hypothetical protein
MRLDGPSGVVAPPLVSGCETSLRVRLGIRSVWTIVWGGDEAAVVVAASVEVSCSPSNCVDRLFDLSRLTWLTVNRLTAGDSVPVNADADLFSRYSLAKSTKGDIPQKHHSMAQTSHFPNPRHLAESPLPKNSDSFLQASAI